MKRKTRRKRHKLRGLVHYCSKCRKKTEHNTEGEKWVRYFETCKICKQINYSEVLRKNDKPQ